MAGMEFIYMNGKHSRFAHTYIKNARMVGWLDVPQGVDGTVQSGPRTRGQADQRIMKFIRMEDIDEVILGLEDKDMLWNSYVHAVHIPGAGSELTFLNLTVVNYQSAFLGCAWCSIGRGGYEVHLDQMT